MAVLITRREHFSASHRLLNPEFSKEKNLRVYGKCANPHGHNYEVEVTVAGEPDNGTGIIMDFKKLSGIIRKEIIGKVDHRDLNLDVGFLKNILPTAENLSVVFWRILKSKIRNGKLYSVRVYETSGNFAEYRGE